ncbi:ABC transporter ATP-binding protein [Desulfurobacterium atlanticum]|uniref:Carbohydrate ABC transporter ATP-binding protein, CUT1 family n=1 Tax=Desulfurobacterium atlanticum TaxID=240169 RepID=A0A238YDU7_9BACT|nr:ABC transporter ATP-binding protein [Desulfurobacterium atlanticum]SNR68774.1 carbohydrate ABC transporter ATP-binding protein, CUT1 family [Desulfurobacterium atlanticum]
MKIALEHLTKKFGDVYAVKDLNFHIGDGEFVALLGPSGCGKTTTMLMIAGIYKPTEGFIKFDGKVVNDLEPRDRNTGMVFQSYALYPHMTVYENITFPLKLKKVPKSEMEEECKKIAKLLQIEHLLNRKPGELSGGQQQRVALGRALIKKPKVLLFDEPLSNLDARLRISMRRFIKEIQREFGITSIYVTHDQEEAMTMADRIAVMKDGVLQTFTTPNKLHDEPENIFVANFIGNPPMNIIDAELFEDKGELYLCLSEGFSVEVPEIRKPRVKKRKVKFGIRPYDVKIVKDGKIPAKVVFVEFFGKELLVLCKIGDKEIQVLVPAELNVKEGDGLFLEFKESGFHFFDPDTGVSLLKR